MNRLLAAIATVFAVSLPCVQPAEAQVDRIVTFGFDGAAPNSLPDGFQTGMTGRWKPTEWGIRVVEANHVLGHFGFWDEDPDGVFPVCWVEGAAARDLTLAVRLFPVPPPPEIRGAVHDGAGLVLRFKDPDNYYLLRAVPHETRVRLYKVVGGKRHTLAGRDLEVATGQWHELKLRVVGSRFTAYFDGRELFTHEDSTFSEAGAFGLWSKPNNVTYFDDLTAEIVR